MIDTPVQIIPPQAEQREFINHPAWLDVFSGGNYGSYFTRYGDPSTHIEYGLRIRRTRHCWICLVDSPRVASSRLPGAGIAREVPLPQQTRPFWG